jgi:hypothetical protein
MEATNLIDGQKAGKRQIRMIKDLFRYAVFSALFTSTLTGVATTVWSRTMRNFKFPSFITSSFLNS